MVICLKPKYLGQAHSLQPELYVECENVLSSGSPNPLLLLGKACSHPSFLQSLCLSLNNLVIESSPVSLGIVQSRLFLACNLLLQ